MPIYEYKCRECGQVYEYVCSAEGDEMKQDLDSGVIRCHSCSHGTLRRKFSFSSPPAFEEHYNGSTGQWTTSNRQFKDDLKRASERATLDTGIEHNYSPISREELQRMAIEKHGDAGLREQHDAAVRRGEREPTSKTKVISLNA